MKLVPFDNAIVCVPVYPFSKSKILAPMAALVAEGSLASEQRVMKVVAVGPGKRVESPENAELALGDPARCLRHPMNVREGDIVLINAAVEFKPGGPGTRSYWVTIDSNVLAAVHDLAFTEDQKAAMEAGVQASSEAAQEARDDDRFIVKR